MALTLILFSALALDALLGDPRRWHPLAGFGIIADGIEARCNNGTRLSGLVCACLLSFVPAITTGIMLTVIPSLWGWAIATVIATLCIGRRSLGEHVRSVVTPLAAKNMPEARRRVGMLVSRETESMDAPAIRRAAIESLLENASDAVFGSLFWFVVGGLLVGPGGAAGFVVAHRLINTLDAMWGYRTPRFQYFGWAAAWLDDVLNWLPARVTALLFALTGQTAAALRCWREQSRQCVSPNGGVVMSTGAGALNLWLGGGAYYHGVWENRVWLGCGHVPENGDIHRALRLVLVSVLVFCALTSGLDWLIDWQILG